MGLLNSNSLNEWAMAIPGRAKQLYQGLLNAPSELAGMFTPEFAQQQAAAIRKDPNYRGETSTFGKPGGLLAPAVQEKAMQLALDVMPGGIAAHTVYHGSPHKFNKFDMSKIGTGEGAQAYGHGLYFAESPGVAKSYQTTLGNYAKDAADIALKNGIKAESDDVLKPLMSLGSAVKYGDMTLEKAAKTATYQSAKLRQYPIESVQKAIREYADMDAAGAFYKVDIPDEAIPKMLDWDRGLEQQPQEVRDAFMQMVPKPGTSSYYDDLLLAAPTKQGGLEYKAPLSRFYQGMGSGSHADLSQKLKQQGIPGIKYLDGMSRADGMGSYNYVLFDDQLPRILEVNGQPTGLKPWAEDGLLGKPKPKKK